MKSGTRLTPTKALRDNLYVYNTFQHAQTHHDEVLNLLDQLLSSATETPQAPLEQLTLLYKLPDYLLIYLFVEIEKIISEGNCFTFANREPFCVPAFFAGLGYAFSLWQQPSFPSQSQKQELDLVLHGINTDISSVKIQDIDATSSGKYRTGSESLRLYTECISIEGIRYLIHLVKTGVLKDMYFGAECDMKMMSTCMQDYETYDLAYKLMNKLVFIDASNPETSLKEVLQSDDYAQITSVLTTLRPIVLLALHELRQSLTVDDYKNRQTIDALLKLLQQNNAMDILQCLKQMMGHSLTINVINSVQLELNSKANKHLDEARRFQTAIVTEATLDESLQFYQVKNEDELVQAFYARFKKDDYLLFEFISAESAFELVQKMKTELSSENIDALYDKSVDEKLFYIYERIQLILLAHPFCNANNRTYANQISPKLHLDLGLPLLVFYNPLFFYAYAPSEIVEVVKLAMANFLLLLHVVEKNKNDYFDFKEKGLSPSQLDEMEKMVAPLRLALAKIVQEQVSAELPVATKPAFFPSKQKIRSPRDSVVEETYPTKQTKQNS